MGKVSNSFYLATHGDDNLIRIWKFWIKDIVLNGNFFHLRQFSNLIEVESPKKKIPAKKKIPGSLKGRKRDKSLLKESIMKEEPTPESNSYRYMGTLPTQYFTSQIVTVNFISERSFLAHSHSRSTVMTVGCESGEVFTVNFGIFPQEDTGSDPNEFNLENFDF
jgi:hypothetical protein